MTKDELVPKIHNVPTKHVRFSHELVESTDHAYLTCDGKRITIHTTNGDYVYRITGYDDDTRYYDTELVVAPAPARAATHARSSDGLT